MQHCLDHQLILRLLLKVLDYTELLQGLLLKVLILVDRELLLCLLLELGIDKNFLFFLVWRDDFRATFNFLLLTKLRWVLIWDFQGISHGSNVWGEHIVIFIATS